MFIITIAWIISCLWIGFMVNKNTKERNTRAKAYYSICKVECKDFGYVCVDKCIRLKLEMEK